MASVAFKEESVAPDGTTSSCDQSVAGAGWACGFGKGTSAVAHGLQHGGLRVNNSTTCLTSDTAIISCALEHLETPGSLHKGSCDHSVAETAPMICLMLCTCSDCISMPQLTTDIFCPSTQMVSTGSPRPSRVDTYTLHCLRSTSQPTHRASPACLKAARLRTMFCGSACRSLQAGDPTSAGCVVPLKCT